MKKSLLLMMPLLLTACMTSAPVNDPAAQAQRQTTRPLLYGLGAGATCATVGAVTAPDGKKGRYARNAGLACGAVGGIAGAVQNSQERERQKQQQQQQQQYEYNQQGGPAPINR